MSNSVTSNTASLRRSHDGSTKGGAGSDVPHPRDIAMRAEQPDYEAIRLSQQMQHNPMHKLFDKVSGAGVTGSSSASVMSMSDDGNRNSFIKYSVLMDNQV